MKTEHYSTGARLFAQGDNSDEAYRIIDGTVEISINQTNSTVVVATLGQGQMFGEMGMIEGCPRSASARALTELTVEVITEQDFNDSIVAGGDMLVTYLGNIFERIRGTNERLREAHEQLETNEGLPAAPQVSAEQTAVKELPTMPPFSSSKPLSGGLLLEPDSDETRLQSALQKQELTSFPFVFGRRADLAACVDVFSKGRLLIGDSMPFCVSRMHCAIEKKKGVYFVQDRGSQLGTIVNGVSLGQGSKEKRVRLQPGTNTLLLGPSNTAIRFILTVPTA